MKAPCLNCENRTAGCHSVCTDYQKYCIDNEALKKKKRLYNLDRTWAAPSQDRLYKARNGFYRGCGRVFGNG